MFVRALSNFLALRRFLIGEGLSHKHSGSNFTDPDVLTFSWGSYRDAWFRDSF